MLVNTMNSSILIVAKCNDSDTHLWNSLIDIKSEPKSTVKYSMGTFIKINNVPYVLACYHGIQNFYELFIYQFKKIKKNKYIINKIEASLECFSDELDLALITIGEGNIDNVEFANIDNFSTKAPNKKTMIKIDYEHTKKTSEDSLSKEKRTIKLVMDDVIFEKYSSFNMPKLPYLKCLSKDLSDDKLVVLKGLSGIMCYGNNKAVGMLMNYDRKDNSIRIIPSIVIQNFVDEYRTTHRYGGLSGIMFKGSMCEFEHNGRDYVGVIVNTTCGIKYQEAIKDDDVIYKIDNRDITKGALIFDPRLERHVPYETYISMNFRGDKPVKINLMRNDVKTNDYEDVVIDVNTISVQMVRNIQINHDDRYCVINGFVFTELTENIIEFYRNHNICLMGDVFERYAVQSYGSYQKLKLIVLINIINNDFNKADMVTINNVGIPLLKKKNAKNEFYLCVLEKINKKKINDLHDLERYASGNVNVLKFSVDKNIKLCINSTDTNLSITYIEK